MKKSPVRSVKNKIKNLMRTAFEVGQRFKVDILPRHFYSEIPDIRTLANTTQWRLPRSMTCIAGDIDAQLAWVDQCTAKHRDSLRKIEIYQVALRRNGSDEGYGEIEADFLYCFVRANRPARVVQVGCGVSTAIILQAAEDEGYTPQITCIEPYPTDFLKREAQAGRINLIPQKLQDVGPECVASLQRGDLFFVDSSHTLAPAGEVNFIMLEALPRLSAGVYVHFHDIYFPYDYSPGTLSSELFFSHETALLYAFLLMNGRFEIAASLSMLHHCRSHELKQIFPAMKPAEFDYGLLTKPGHFPSSIYLSCKE